MTQVTAVPYNHDLSRDSIQHLYSSKLQASFNKFARAITGRKSSVTVRIDPAMHATAPAWSDDTDITVVHHPELGSILSASNIMRLKGLAIHELSHLLFTPRSKTQVFKWAIDNNLGNAFNILEDNRIENLMVAKLSGIKPWLINAVTSELLSQQQLKSLLPLVWGRKYLPKSLRKQALTAWPHANGVDIASVIDRYLRINPNTTSEFATVKSLLIEFNTLLNQANAEAEVRVPTTTHKHTSCAPDSGGDSKPLSKSEQDKLSKQFDKIDNDNDDTQDDHNTNNSADTTDTNDSDPQSAAQQLRGMLEQVQSESYENLTDDVKNTIQSIRESVSDSGDMTARYKASQKVTKLEQRRMIYQAPMPEAVVASRKFAQELTELRTLYDPYWVRKTDQGRLNVHQFLVDADFDELFDKWDQGNQEVTDIECVILLDNSHSMYEMFDKAYNSMWSIKRALDSVGASTTVVQFAWSGGVLYEGNKPAGTKIATARHANGGDTHPLSSIQYAKSILDQSSRAIKMFIVITDGYWSDTLSCDQAIMNLRMSGVLTGLVYLNDPDGVFSRVYQQIADDGTATIRVDGHKCEVVTSVSNPLDIVNFAKSMTRLSQKKMLSI
jgi:hypothetical protein